MTTCEHCNKPLRDVEETHAWNGMLFCSRACAIAEITNDIILNAKETAIETYDAEAEVVATQDILADELCLSVEDIYNTIKALAQHSGYYTRLYDWLTDGGELFAYFWLKGLASEHLKDEVALILRLECGDE